MAGSNTFVLAAQVAANLHFATKVAEELSLTAKNAHAISARAGQQAAGFRAITSYIEELAENTISSAQSINHEAISVAQLASQSQRAKRALEHFERVTIIAPDASFISSVENPRSHTEEWLRSIDNEFSVRLKHLQTQVQDAQQQTRAAAIIASTSKVEANFSGDFQGQLEVIADNITRSSDEISGHLKQAQQLLNAALDNIE